MARIEKTVFISYRRTDVYTALAVYENLKNQGYDVFFDYRSISGGDFEQIITSNIKARAHFLLILTPAALDRCNEPGDWLRREIEIAINERRNVVPLFFKGFQFGIPPVSEKLTGKLKSLGRYNGLNVHEDYFDEAMHRLRTQYLNIPLETVLHPVSTEVLKVVRDEQIAADKALQQLQDAKEVSSPTFKFRWLGTVGIVLIALTLGVLGGMYLIASRPPALTIGSTMIGNDDMTLLYVPAGEFTMGSDSGNTDEQPAHRVNLAAFWIDKTEVTNAMYSKCVQEGKCSQPSNTAHYTDSNYANHPVVYVFWNDANTYCSWAGRRLPTEAEWEKAARGTNGHIYPWGNDAPNDSLLNYKSAVQDTTEVGKYPDGASPYGALDIAGNVWEWVADWYDANYYAVLGENARNPQGPTQGQYHVQRGGAWDNNDDEVRSANRDWYESSPANLGFFGFRCAMSATP